MSSELWQRIRAARKYADLKQQDVATACGVSRGAVAQWEYEDPVRRTTPSIDQMKALSKLAKVPFDWLLNDAASLDDIWQYAKINEPAPAEETDFTKDVIAELVKMQFFDPMPGFYRTVGQNSTAIQADFVFKDVAIQFADRFDMDDVAKMLLLDRAAGGIARKVLMVRSPIAETQAQQVKEVFGVTVEQVRSAKAAACEIHKMLA